MGYTSPSHKGISAFFLLLAAAPSSGQHCTSWYFAAPYKLLHFPQNSNAVSVACLLSFRDPVSSTFGTAHMLEHCQDWLQSRTMDSLPRRTPGVFLWLVCSWVCSNRQDHTRFLTPSTKHHCTAIFCHTRHLHIFLPAKLRMSNHKTSEVQGFVRMLFLIFENYRKYKFLQLLKGYVVSWTWSTTFLIHPRPTSVTVSGHHLTAPTNTFLLTN